MKQIRLIASILAITVVLSSCKKQLQVDPTDSISEANAFQTIGDIQLGVNGAYGDFGAYLNNIYVNALLTDEAKLGPNNAGQGALTYRYQFSSDGTTGGDVVGAYSSYYYMIDQCNRTLEKIDGITADQTRKNKLKAELLALRGVAHFEILRTYADRYNPTGLGIAIVKNVNPLALPSRVSMGESLTAIEKDLTDAKALFPTATAATFSDTVFNSINLAGYQARVALYKGDYQAAIDYSTTVINSAVKPLVTGAAFAGIWTDVNLNEVLFRYRYETSSALGGLWTTTGGDIYISPSDKLVASYSSTDIRKASYIGTNTLGTYVNKYYASTRGGRVVHMKVMRTAEMYLLRAEAYSKLATPNLTAGAADLNSLRAQRITGYTPVTFTTSADLLAAVLDERFKELAFEGSRFFDLKRNNLPVARLATDASTLWQNLPANSFRFVLPVPRDAINANPNIVQNPGY